MDFITLRNGDLTARINPTNQQLCSIEHKGVEFMHPGGRPDATAEERGWWPNSEILMFPVVGPVAGDAVRVPVGDREVEVPMSQHGLARYLMFRQFRQDATYAHARMSYEEGTPVRNPKTGQELRWPFSFSIGRSISMAPVGLEVLFTIINDSDRPMPYEFGWHPAFKTFEARGQRPGELRYHQTLGDGMLPSRVGDTTVERLQAEGVLKFDGRSSTYSNGSTGIDLEETEEHPDSIEHMMLWSPKGSKLVCMEPVTRLPDGSHFEFGYDMIAPGGQKSFGYRLVPYHYAENR